MEGLRKRIIDFSHRKSLDEPTVYLDEEEQEVLIRELEKTNRRDNRLFQIVFSFLYLLISVPLVLHEITLFQRVFIFVSIFFSSIYMYFFPVEESFFTHRNHHPWRVTQWVNIAIGFSVILLDWKKGSDWLYQNFISAHAVPFYIAAFSEASLSSMQSATSSIQRLNDMRYHFEKKRSL